MARLPDDGVSDRGLATIESHGEEQLLTPALLSNDRLRRATRQSHEIALVVHGVRTVRLTRDVLPLRELDVQSVDTRRRGGAQVHGAMQRDAVRVGAERVL